MDQKSKAYLYIHICVILWGFTAILGELIQLPALMIVLWRVYITSISLIGLLWFYDRLVKIGFRQFFIFAGIGVIVGLHWLTFYGAIKLANASIALVCFATTSFLTSIIEPLIVKSKFSLFDLAIGIVIIPSMIFIVNGLPSKEYMGVAVGITSALLATIFSTLNKKYVNHADPIYISAVEISSATIFLIIILPFVYFLGEPMPLMPTGKMDWIYLIILALACTTLPFILSMIALKQLSAFATNLVINLEPVYGIILAIFILNEHKELNINFYIGATVIMISVFIYPILKKKFNPSHEK